MVKKILISTFMNNTIKIANAPCSWGALEFDLEGKALGFEQVLNEMQETGYAGTELGDWGFMPTDPEILHAEISKRNFQLLGAFVPVALKNPSAHEAGIQKAIQTAGLMHAAGYKNAFIVLADENGTIEFRTKNAGRIETGNGLTEDEMKIFAAGAEKVAQAVKVQYGMRTVFHHHCAGYIETPAEIEALLEHTNPDLLGLCFDTGHFSFGGGTDHVGFLKTHQARIWHVHFKDFSPEVAEKATQYKWDYFQSVANGVFCELGKGSVDFGAVKAALDNLGYTDWIVVEQDVLPGMGNPKQCALNNRQYLKQIGL
jgi:inosose dehydratase